MAAVRADNLFLKADKIWLEIYCSVIGSWIENSQQSAVKLRLSALVEESMPDLFIAFKVVPKVKRKQRS